MSELSEQDLATTHSDSSTTVESEVGARLARIRQRIASACAACGREPSEITVVAVSKRQSLERIEAAVAAGQTLFGENRVREALAKMDALAEKESLAEGLEWHLIGPLQSNKVKLAAGRFDVIHSLDRLRIGRRLDREAGSLGRRLDVFVQVNIGGEESKHGFAEAAFEHEVRPLCELEHLRLVGLMAIPPYERDPEAARPWFRRLRELRDLAAEWPEWSEFPGWLSMGMSHDLEVAIAEGATHVRPGTDVFGPRVTPSAG